MPSYVQLPVVPPPVVGGTTEYVPLPAPFTPLALGSTLKLWLRGDLGVTLAGPNVTAWADQSGSGNHTTNVNTVPFVASSINGNPGITCNGASGMQNLTSSPIAAGGPRTIFLVIKGSSEVGGAVYCNYRTSHTQEVWMYGSSSSIPGLVYACDGTANGYQTIPAQVLMTPHVVKVAVTGGAGALCAVTIDGIAKTVTSVAPTVVETGSLGFGVGISPYFTSGFGWTGDICEVIVCDTVLSVPNQTLVYGYLSGRYGI